MEDTKLNLKEQTKILETEYNIDIFVNYEDNQLILFNFSKGKTRTFKLPKNVSLEWIIKKINLFLDSSYTNLNEVFKKVNLNGYTYPTSYGIGYNCLFSNNEKFTKDVNLIEEKLNSLNIKFKAQFSEQRHCLRFIISQSEENLNIIKNI